MEEESLSQAGRLCCWSPGGRREGALPSLKGKVDFSKVDTTNYKDIKVENAPVVGVHGASLRRMVEVQVGNARHATCWTCAPDGRSIIRKRPSRRITCIRRATTRRDETTNSQPLAEWRLGSGRQSIWETVSQRCPEVDGRRCPLIPIGSRRC